MSNNKQSSVEWYINITNFVPNIDILGDEIYNKLTIEQTNRIHFLGKQAKAMHKEEHGQTWDKSMENFEARGRNEMRAWVDFDNYYNETFGGNNEQQ